MPLFLSYMPLFLSYCMLCIDHTFLFVRRLLQRRRRHHQVRRLGHARQGLCLAQAIFHRYHRVLEALLSSEQRPHTGTALQQMCPDAYRDRSILGFHLIRVFCSVYAKSGPTGTESLEYSYCCGALLMQMGKFPWNVHIIVAGYQFKQNDAVCQNRLGSVNRSENTRGHQDMMLGFGYEESEHQLSVPWLKPGTKCRLTLTAKVGVGSLDPGAIIPIDERLVFSNIF